MKISVVRAGVAGLLLAFTLVLLGHSVADLGAFLGNLVFSAVAAANFGLALAER